MNNFTENDTIAAIATPLGEGGLAVIRLSGPQALTIADRCFKPIGAQATVPTQAATHTLHYGIIRRAQQRIDEVMLAVMRTPHSFTREDTVEITCHGGVLAAKLVLDTVLEQGARLAMPGEFTKRAFLNGRIDLTQAEAVADLIQARTELALAAANEQLAGRLSQRINQLRDELMGILAHVEAQLDFPEEDIAPDTRQQMVQRLERALTWIESLLLTAEEGQILRQGLRTAIIGRPNTGKSSLLNQLLGHDRAIVSPIPGTTRDTIEETANIRGLPVVFIDTAGVRRSDDPIEQEGIRRSHAALAKAELVLQVLDGSMPLTEADTRFLTELTGKKHLLIRNKIDLPSQIVLPASLSSKVVAVSCLTGEGIETLKDTIQKLVWQGEVRPDRVPVMINSRHQDALRRTRQALQHTRDSLQADLSLELVALDLRLAVNAVGEIVGKTTTEDLLDAIFSQFCLGK